MKFNNIIKIALALGIFASVSSCSDDRMDVMPTTEEVYEGKLLTAQELEYLLNNAYGSLNSAAAFGANAIIYGELMSDNAFISTTNDGYYTSLNAMNFNAASSDAATTWSQYYNIIRNANLIIYAEVVEEDLGSQLVLEVKAQAHIMKGMAYLMLAKYFSPSPKLGMDSPYGIVLKHDPWHPVEAKTRSSLQETYDAIIQELETGIENLPNFTGEKYYLTKTVANFLLAKTHLYFGNNEQALIYANKVLNESPGDYSLIGNDDYVDYFSASDNVSFQENQPETLYEVPQTPVYNLQVNAHPGVFFASNGQHRSIIYRTAFRDSFDDTDVRKQLFGNNGPNSDTPQGIFIRKWQRTNSEGPFTQDIKVFRMTEALFIKWEAMAKLGQNPLDELNAFAQSRGGSTYSGDALTAVLDEKRKEFFGEGTRYYDLKRNGLPIAKGTNCFNCDIAADDKLFVFPIPFIEIEKNPDIEQYPGY